MLGKALAYAAIVKRKMELFFMFPGSFSGNMK
jgi:hypothetical protein